MVSVLWHCLWLFGVRVDVDAVNPFSKVRPSIHFMGPVIDDDFFETIVRNRPESSRTSYQIFENEEMLEPSPGELAREIPEGIVHTGLGRSSGSLAGVLGQKRSIGTADTGLGQTLGFETLKSPFPLSGPLAGRELYHIPPVRDIRKRLEREDKARMSAEAVFEMFVDPNGDVNRVEIRTSSGSASIDGVWTEYLKDWLFMPLPSGRPGELTRGRLTVRADGGAEGPS